MKILFIAHNGHPYGANKSLLSIINHLKKSHQVMLVTPFKNEFINSDNRIVNINFLFFPTLLYVKIKPKYILFPMLLLLDFFTFPFLLYKIAKFNPDLIYSNTSVENTGIISAKILRKKHITHVREFGDLDFGLKCIFGKKFKRWLLSQSDGLIFNSRIVRDIELPVQYQKTKCQVIYNGINMMPTSYLCRPMPTNDFINVGIVGFIHPKKRQLEAVRFMKDLFYQSNFKLLIYGDGEKKYIKKIQDYIHFNKLECNVSFQGYVTDIEKIYSEIDILLVFSQNEAFGRVTIEAMQKGIPVVAYKGGGTIELIQHNVDGFLFETAKEFQYYMNLLTSNANTYQDISKKAIDKVNSHFSEESYVNNIEYFVKDILLT